MACAYPRTAGAAGSAPRIVGLGTALVDVVRFEAFLGRFGARGLRRLFTPGELAYAARRARGRESLAVRFAAKLAAQRALGAGRLGWQELEVVRQRGRAPQLQLYGRAARAAARLGVARSTLTLTHDPTFCVGQVLLEGGA